MYFLGIGYASVTSVSLNIAGNVDVQSGVFIIDVTCDDNNSNTNFVMNILSSNVFLPDSNSSVICNIKMFKYKI